MRQPASLCCLAVRSSACSYALFVLSDDRLFWQKVIYFRMKPHTSRKRYHHSPRLFVSPPFHSPQRRLFSRIALPFLLCLLLFSGALGNGVLTPQAHAAVVSPPPPAHATTTIGKFLAQKAPALKPFVYPKEPPMARFAKEQSKNLSKPLPSSEPIHMTPLQQVVTPAFLASSATTTTAPLQLHGSDGRLTVSIPAGAIDASGAVSATTKASVASMVQAQGVHLTITQRLGISTGNMNSLGFYQFQFSDAQGHALTGIRVRHPITIQFHYAPADLQGLGLDPGTLLLTWPTEINQAVAAKTSVSGWSVPMSNNAATHTLTVQTSMIGSIASVGTGSPTNQAPPKPLLATVQPNTGQLSYVYPITVAPGPTGTTPTVQLIYSSQSTNQRYEPTSPADSPGEGWGMSLGSISMTNYPAGSALSGNWYFLSGVDNVSDRLVPTTSGGTTYYTEHVSHLKIQQVTPSGATQPCFHV